MFKLWYLLSKEVDLVAMFVLFDLQNSSFLSFSSCEVDNHIYSSLWWLLGGCCHLYVEWSLCCLMIRFNIAFQSMYCSFTVKSLWFSRFCSVWFDSTHVRSLSLLAFTFFYVLHRKIFAVSACGYWVDFAAFYDEVIVIFMVNCCDNYGEFP